MAFGAPPPGFMSLLDRKYALQARDIASRERVGDANAALNLARAAAIPLETQAQADLAAARAAGFREDTAQSRADFDDPFGVRRARISNEVAQAGLFGEQGASERHGRSMLDYGVPQTFNPAPTAFGFTPTQVESPRLGGGLPTVSGTGVTRPLSLRSANPLDNIGPAGRARIEADDARRRESGALAYAKGTSRVPGKGDGTRDTVKAKLAPGEAVLNKAAADHMGRGLIAAMNAHGARKMGMV